MKKLLLLSLTLFFPLLVHADGVNISGIYYNLIHANGSAFAEVTKSPNDYSGDIVIPESVTHLGVDYSVTAIGNKAFIDCQEVTSITLPSTIKSIGKQSFQGCSNIKYVNLSEGLTSIGERAFWLSGLITVELPSTLTTIENEAFMQCGNMMVVRSKIEKPTDVNVNTFMNGMSGGTYLNPTDPTYVATLYVPKGTKELYQSRIGWNKIATIKETDSNNIVFSDDKMRHYCVTAGLNDQGVPMHYSRDRDFDKIVTKWDTNGDGELSYDEAAAITDVGSVFGFRLSTYNNTKDNYAWGKTEHSIRFEEFKYFKGVTRIATGAFASSFVLYPIIIPEGVTSIESNAFAGDYADVYCYANQVPYTAVDAFNGLVFEKATLHVPEKSIGLYKAVTPWNQFKNIVAIVGESSGSSKCAAPTINYSRGKLSFSCDTEGVEFVSEITDADVKKHNSSSIQLSATYNICVYAVKKGFDNSDTVTATLCWIDEEPKTEGITNGVAEVRAKAVLIKSNGGQLTVEGVDEGQIVDVYSLNGEKRGSAVGMNGTARIETKIQPGGVAIIKVGDKSVKVIVK